MYLRFIVTGKQEQAETVERFERRISLVSRSCGNYCENTIVSFSFLLRPLTLTIYTMGRFALFAATFVFLIVTLD